MLAEQVGGTASYPLSSATVPIAQWLGIAVGALNCPTIRAGKQKRAARSPGNGPRGWDDSGVLAAAIPQMAVAGRGLIALRPYPLLHHQLCTPPYPLPPDEGEGVPPGEAE